MTLDAADLHVVVVGAFAGDCVVRMPHMPGWGEDHEATSIHTSPGGKALNQAVALARLGARVTAVGAVGNDSLGSEVRGLLDREGVDASGIEVRADTATPVCLCFVGEDGKATYVAHTPLDVAVTPETVRRPIAAFSSADAVLVTFEPRPDAIQEAIQLGRGTDSTVVVHPAPTKHDPSDITTLPWSDVDVLVPNRTEARWLLGEAADEVSESLAGSLAHALKIPTVAVTLGQDGCELYSDGGFETFCTPDVPHVADPTGASDAFTTAFLLHLLRDLPEAQAIDAALSAAARSLARSGGHPSMPTVAELGQG